MQETERDREKDGDCLQVKGQKEGGTGVVEGKEERKEGWRGGRMDDG